MWPFFQDMGEADTLPAHAVQALSQSHFPVI